MNTHSNLQSRARRIACIGMVLLTALAGCGGGGGGDDDETVVTPPPRQTPAPRPMIPINPGSGSQSLPPVYSPQNPPQAGGRDASGVEVSGLGNITQVAVRNTRSGSVTFQAGQWFEPKDGGFQRMITTRTTSVPSGSTVNVPVACMQREKGAPANGLRFFSQPKTASDATQQCQVNCLSSGGNPQSCVWGCQSSDTSGGGTRQGVEITLTDNCNDGDDIAFRIFQYSSLSDPDTVSPSSYTNRAWPGGSNAYITTGFDGTVSERLACDSSSYWACFGAIPQDHFQAGQRRNYWGVGIDHQFDCTGCCASCDGGELNYTLTCN